jgi:SAM-dependent methyltransferase
MWPWNPGKALFRTQEALLFAGEDLPRRSADLGCGNGEFASLLPSRVSLGVDADLSRVEAACRTGVYRWVLCADLTRLPLQASSLDCALSNSVLEHVEDLYAAVAEVHRTLRPGGKFILTVPSPRMREWLYFSRHAFQQGDEGLAERYRHHFDLQWKHLRYLNADEVSAVLSTCGFRDIITTEYESQAEAEVSDILSNVSFAGISCPDPAVSRLLDEGWRSLLYDLLLPLVSTPVTSPGAGVFCKAVK